ncbi:helix-turn-helix domain-containing protein [Anaerosporobacter faecicola]|uniref:helix-turn-helix domain-containing protein n=1 Tax=Anaerosporobacter faecicola TaxID=2718714 RepID=UPI00143AA028|nr:helix-turn-helix transcriptional regulator [Anaerosporobacter faecicola]
MGYSYNKLWKRLIDYNMNKVTLREKAGLSTTTLARLSKNEKVSLDAIAKICDTLECNIGDIMDYVREDKHDNK